MKRSDFLILATAEKELRSGIFILVILACFLPAGAQSVTATLPSGSGPAALTINPATNKIYVANSNGSTLTVIDGATNSTSTIAVGTHPYAVAVNQKTNKIYVANLDSDNVTVIDGTTTHTDTVRAGHFPDAVAVNPATNKIYVANGGSSTVTVIDGTTNGTTTSCSANRVAAQGSDSSTEVSST